MRTPTMLEDARFWVRIMKEHALFIELGLPCTATELREDAAAFQERFELLQARLNEANRLTPTLRAAVREAVEAFIAYKEHVTRQLIQCNLAASTSPLLLAHITREARHFLALLEDEDEFHNRFVRILSLEVFWLRIMKEHVEFTIHLLDPSQTTLLAQAQEFEVVFSRLLETGRDLLSMAKANPVSFPTVNRFTAEVVARTRELRDFKAAAHELALICELLSTASTPLLIDHIRREADKFLDELESIQRELQAS